VVASSASDLRERLADETLLLDSQVFGDRIQSQLYLGPSGKASFSAGLVSLCDGDWRVVGGDPEEGEDPSDCFLEFSQPLDWFYGWRFDIRADEVYWRGRIVEDPSLRVVDGVAISESVCSLSEWQIDWRKALDLQATFNKYVLGNKFQKEGTFEAELVDPESLPQPLNLEFVYEEEEDEATFFEGDRLATRTSINRFTPDDDLPAGEVVVEEPAMTVKLPPDDSKAAQDLPTKDLPVEEATFTRRKRKRKRTATTKKGFSGK